MLTLYILCGAPASGKTTLSKKMAEQEDLIRISYDEMRCRNQRELIKYMVQALKENKSTIIDSVNNCAKNREMLLDAVKDIPCKKILIVMQTTLEECIRRNRLREYPMSDGCISVLYNSIQNHQPTLDEGWDEILYCK